MRRPSVRGGRLSWHEFFDGADVKMTIESISDPEPSSLAASESKLSRPRVDLTGLACVAGASLCGAFAVSLTGVLAYGSVVRATFSARQVFPIAIAVFPFVVVVGALVFSKRILIQCILLYQRFASSDVRLRCCFEPSCSEYAILALKRYGTVVGCIKAIGRLRRCRDPGGIDYP